MHPSQLMVAGQPLEHKKMCAAKSSKKKINLALQGGGAHGAYAWGVIDQIIEDGRLEIEGICATSAGTMNAVAYAYGKHTGGLKNAQKTLHDFWWNVHQEGQKYGPVQRNIFEKFLLGENWNMDYSPGFMAFDAITRMISPYQFNPFDFNPLKDVLEKTIDFKELKNCQCTKLFISATHIKTGKVRVFNAQEVSLDVVMASACLPFLFKAVEIDKNYYWDGGYVGNPALFPFFYDTKTQDLMIVHINPLIREELPTTAPDIMNRINEISFNSSLYSELRSIAFVKKLLANNMLKPEYQKNFKNVLVHSIRADEVMKDLSVASKFSSDWEFLTHLRDAGRQETKKWLSQNYSQIGKQDTVDIHNEFLCSVNRMFEPNQAA